MTITAELSVADAAVRMRENDVGSLVVVSNGVVEGIITSWDVAVGCVGAGEDPAMCPIMLYMSSPVHTARPETGRRGCGACDVATKDIASASGG